MQELSAAFCRLYDIIVRLRAPGGCPWDREQTPQSLRGDLIEETYECVEAIDEQDPVHIKEELGDLFLLVTMLSYIHEEQGLFSVANVLDAVSEKLVRRHPHVFAGLTVKDSQEVLDNWARIKVEQEGRKPKDSLLDKVSTALPPLDRAYKLQKEAAKVGFDWPDREGPIRKIHEELREVLEAASALEGSDPGTAADAVEAELGDLLFSVVNLCRFFQVEPSVALQRTNGTFTKRFKYIEKHMAFLGKELSRDNLVLMDEIWQAARHPPTVEAYRGQRREE
ncbi:MAG: nucleoside triphosphate pyrophosphohydrolase [Spirochaetaceae bacterium]|jgi:tetrapyrrole methylase family protein/MazG family protein|nr:nucleoside triphosphate pyrophosphohydrolase [Spirochaetaceae bacterium]